MARAAGLLSVPTQPSGRWTWTPWVQTRAHFSGSLVLLLLPLSLKEDVFPLGSLSLAL